MLLAWENPFIFLWHVTCILIFLLYKLHYVSLGPLGNQQVMVKGPPRCCYLRREGYILGSGFCLSGLYLANLWMDFYDIWWVVSKCRKVGQCRKWSTWRTVTVLQQGLYFYFCVFLMKWFIWLHDIWQVDSGGGNQCLCRKWYTWHVVVALQVVLFFAFFGVITITLFWGVGFFSYFAVGWVS